MLSPCARGLGYLYSSNLVKILVGPKLGQALVSLKCAELVLLAMLLLTPVMELPVVVALVALVLFSFGQTVIIQLTCISKILSIMTHS